MVAVVVGVVVMITTKVKLFFSKAYLLASTDSVKFLSHDE
jgi:hypothetical protein